MTLTGMRELPCERGCVSEGSPMEDCSLHGRTPAELWEMLADLNRRLERADHHLRLRTAALHRVIARERRQSAIVVGTTAYFPGRVREIVERYHRWTQR